jgi:GAF domain-containing protein
MSENIFKHEGSKAQQYEALLPQIQALLSGESDVMANMANVAAALKTQFDWHWVGFYRVVGEELVLGPFQGPVACTRIAYGRGVCGSAWAQNQTLIVPDVEAFPGHIACSALSKSEIVVPMLNKGKMLGVLDVDATERDAFDATDQAGLEAIVQLLMEGDWG